MDRQTEYIFVQLKDHNSLINSNMKFLPVIYYQVAMFKNNSNKYNLRKFIIDDENRIVDVQSYWMNKYNVKKLINDRKVNLYKIFPVYNLNCVPYPSAADLATARSNLINNTPNYTGYAPFY